MKMSTPVLKAGKSTLFELLLWHSSLIEETFLRVHQAFNEFEVNDERTSLSREISAVEFNSILETFDDFYVDENERVTV